MKSPDSGVTQRDAAGEAAIARELAAANQAGESLRPVVDGLFEAPPQPDSEFMRFSMAAYRHLGVSDDVRLFMGRLWVDSMQSWTTSERARFLQLTVQDRHGVFQALDFSAELFARVHFTADEVLPWIVAARHQVGNDLMQGGLWGCIQAFCATTPAEAVAVAGRWLSQTPAAPSLAAIGNMVGWLRLSIGPGHSAAAAALRPAVKVGVYAAWPSPHRQPTHNPHDHAQTGNTGLSPRNDCERRLRRSYWMHGSGDSTCSPRRMKPRRGPLMSDLSTQAAAMWDRYDPRSDERDRGGSWDRSLGSRGVASEPDRDEGRDPRDVFTKDLDLPRGRERRTVRERDRVYEIDSTESRALARIGAFRVIAESDLHDLRDDSQSSRRSLKHLENEGLIRTSPLSSEDRAVTLTDRGRDLLEVNRSERDDRSHEPRQTFYAGVRKPRELTHDTKVYRAYGHADVRLRGQGGRVRRVVLDYELKRDYQRFLHERNRGRKDCDGRPDREPEEIARWAREHDLPYDDGHVRFPDARIEYEDRDGRSRHEDIEVVTAHYRGAHAGAAAKSGFTCYVVIGGMVGGRGGGGRRTAHPRFAEELIR